MVCLAWSNFGPALVGRLSATAQTKRSDVTQSLLARNYRTSGTQLQDVTKVRAGIVALRDRY